jgi:CheY-like chemotaxis protein
VAKILVADDNSNIQKMVGLALKDQGIDVVAVGNGEAAVRKISDIRPDLVLADVFMPVRNGYEVCRYVKEDSSLAHIPVILLVGAFDPLDEQEAQRVGADGVLKKPFVPPDPLISMVKSALTRAGVSLGPAAQVEKAPVAAKRSTADILSAGVGSKLDSVSAEKPPEAIPEPPEEFPIAAPHLKIAAGSEPLAFGSLLDTTEVDDLAITAKPMIELAKGRKWEEESDEPEEEKEEAEEASSGGWRPEGLGATLEQVATSSQEAPDWRDEAFHGNSPAGSFPSTPWTPSDPQPSFVEAAESHTVAVAAVESKPVGETSPFTGDAWAAAMAAGVEEKLEEIKEVAPAVTPTETVQEQNEEPSESLAEASSPLQDAVAFEPGPAVESAPCELPAEPANWAAAPEAAWEMEAKKASLLASTWDQPKTSPTDETQEVPAYAAEPVTEHIEAPAEAPIEEAPYSGEPVAANESEEMATDPGSGEQETSSFGTAEPKSWENTWEAPGALPVETVMEEVSREMPRAEEAPVSARPSEENVPDRGAEAHATPPAQPDMDELVARVLGKMNPEILQKVTREILRPVIEAIVRDEIDAKKS